MIGKILLWAFGLLMLAGIALGAYEDFYQETHPNYWLVEVVFCDKRPPVHLTIRKYTQPVTADIENEGPSRRGHALSEYHGYLNVCEIRTIKQIHP